MKRNNVLNKLGVMVAVGVLTTTSVFGGASLVRADEPQENVGAENNATDIEDDDDASNSSGTEEGGNGSGQTAAEDTATNENEETASDVTKSEDSSVSDNEVGKTGSTDSTAGSKAAEAGGNTESDGLSSDNGSSGENGVSSDENTDGAEEETEESEEEPSEEEVPPVVRPATGAREVTDPNLVEDHHFWTIGKTYAFAAEDLEIRDDMDDEAKVIGTLERKGVMYIILDEDEEWLYVESGECRGFVRKAQVLTGNLAESRKENYYREAGAKTDEEKAAFDWSAYIAETTVPVSENAAYAYYRATTEQVVIDKHYARPLVSDILNIRESNSADSALVAEVSADTILYVIADADQEWVYVESGNARGFVRSDLIEQGNAVDAEVEAELKVAADAHVDATADTGLAELDVTGTKVILAPEDNAAYFYTKATVVSGRPSGAIGESLVEYASSYIGNPYVWGGTSLTDGADCSGFVQSVYAQYGIELPRGTEEQSQQGQAISLEDALPGDLVFYKDASGYIYHVAIYAGDNKTVEAYGTATGIISGTVMQNKVAWCVRILDMSKVPEIVSTGDAVEIIPGEAVGGVYAYEKWDTNWHAGTFQKALYDQYENYDSEGFGRIGDRYVIACTTTFGQVGDLIDFELSDGTVIKTIMGDAKNNENDGTNIYGHLNGQNVIEFLVDSKTWYNGHSNPGTPSCHPEWGGKTVVKAINYGNVIG